MVKDLLWLPLPLERPSRVVSDWWIALQTPHGACVYEALTQILMTTHINLSPKRSLEIFNVQPVSLSRRRGCLRGRSSPREAVEFKQHWMARLLWGIFLQTRQLAWMWNAPSFLACPQFECCCCFRMPWCSFWQLEQSLIMERYVWVPAPFFRWGCHNLKCFVHSYFVSYCYCAGEKLIFIKSTLSFTISSET